VTGASQGIGLAIVKALIADGAQVLACSRSALRGDGELATLPGVQVSRCDVTDESQVSDVVAEAVRLFGTVDVLVNNAGVLHSRLLVETTAEIWDQTHDVNVRGMFFFLKHVAPVMRQNPHGGSIVNVGSISSFVGEQMSTAYVASKGAVLMLTKNAAAEFAADRIRVNMIAPGSVDTPMNEAFFADMGGKQVGDAILAKAQPLTGLIPPEDVANVVAFLASDRSRSMTGSTLLVDGGLTASWDHFA
jgi:NAD(P)-dependent dehydrogenase (short-subunit alcohol dehydrogenase family)